MVGASCTLPRHVMSYAPATLTVPTKANTEVLLGKHLKDLCQWMMIGTARAHFHNQLLAAHKELLALPAFIEYLCQSVFSFLHIQTITAFTFSFSQGTIWGYGLPKISPKYDGTHARDMLHAVQL